MAPSVVHSAAYSFPDGFPAMNNRSQPSADGPMEQQREHINPNRGHPGEKHTCRDSRAVFPQCRAQPVFGYPEDMDQAEK